MNLTKHQWAAFWRHRYKLEDPSLYKISKGEASYSDIREIFVFRDTEEWWHLELDKGSVTYRKNELRIEKSCLDKNQTRNRLDYLRAIAGINELKNDDGEVLLQKQYETLTFVGEDTALAVYLRPKSHSIQTFEAETLIFPFGGNASQFKAVANALEKQISVIQGPPGTGKTQTILNIIANLLVRGKTVQVVSNNNSATQNVLEKLSSPKCNLGFLVAALGKKENKQAFIAGQTGRYPDMSAWAKSPQELSDLQKNVTQLSAEVSGCFEKQERLAVAKQELDALKIESQYFTQYCETTKINKPNRQPRKGIKSETVLRILQECETYSEKSVCTVIPYIPQTLLREHYRCHPKIIGFCNQKFYQNQLITMTEDHDEPDTLCVYRTVEGQHHRGHINQRQIDVTKNEVLPQLKDTAPQDIGIIAPYRAQVEEFAKTIGNDAIEVDTVHKFQGREKDVIILTTVDDEVTDFSDDPYLLNVAISRAKKKLILVVSGNQQPADSNIYDLVAYIEYHNYSVVDSELHSVFDLLYQQYTKQRLAYLAKHKRISEFDSENLMYAAICDILQEMPDTPLNVICHQSIRLLLRNCEKLTDEEFHYAMNPNTHVDFLIYNRITKAPVLVIEVDGFHYHKDGTEQVTRDRMKDEIFAKYGIPILRLPTNGSAEIQKIKDALKNN